MGTFSPAKLSDNVLRFAYISGFKDPRYPPISPSENDRLSVYVSVLHSFEEMKDELDWDLGTHGINVDFEVSGENYGGTYLPNVPTLNGWD